jgi:hypothetical protein
VKPRRKLSQQERREERRDGTESKADAVLHRTRHSRIDGLQDDGVIAGRLWSK